MGEWTPMTMIETQFIVRRNEWGQMFEHAYIIPFKSSVFSILQAPDTQI